MRTTTRKFGCRAISALVSLICMFTVMFGSAQPVFAQSDYEKVSVQLTFVNDNDSVTTITDHGHKAVYDLCMEDDMRDHHDVKMALNVTGNGSISAGQIKIKIPFYAFANRTEPASDKPGAALASYENFKAELKSVKDFELDETETQDPIDETDLNAVIVLKSKATSALQANFELSYRVNSLDIKDEFPYDYTIEVTDTVADKTITPEPIDAVFKTSVERVVIRKSTDHDSAADGCYARWDKSLMKKYDMKTALGISDDEISGLDDSEKEALFKARFNALTEQYDFISFYIERSNVDANQRYVMYINEMPENSGEVVAVSHKYSETRFTPLKIETAGTYEGQWIDRDTANKDNRILVLVKYPKDKASYNSKNNKEYKNKARVTLVGVDGKSGDVASDTKSKTVEWQDITNSGSGDIWGVDKKGYSDPDNAMALLRNGRDVTVKYQITGTGKTYKYAIDTNFDYGEEEYCLELVDDAMFLTGMGSDGKTLIQLGPDDFYFKTFTADLKHNDVVSVNLKNEPEEEHHVREAARKPLEVWVMKASNPGEWVLDQELTHFSRENRHYCDENGNETFTLKNKDAYKLKFRYPKANGNVKLISQVEGVLRGKGENVSKVIANADANDIGGIQLFNSDGVIGTDKAGNWLNPDSGENIESSNRDAKRLLLEYDESAYEDHKYTGEEEPKVTMRMFAKNKLLDTDTFSGAAKMLDKTNAPTGVTFTSDKKIYIDYLLAGVNAGAASADDVRELAAAGILDGGKKIVFHELLPRGFALGEVEEFKGSKDFTGHYTWNSFASTAGLLETVNDDVKAKITVETEDNYKGTLRQMATITLEYDEIPVIKLSDIDLTEQTFIEKFGTGAVIKLRAAADFSDVNKNIAVNDAAVQFINENGKSVPLNGDNVYADDGSVFSSIKDREGNNAFEDIDNDGDKDSTTVAGASCNANVEKVYTATQLVKKIKADDYDTMFKDYTQTYAGHDYTYKLHFFTNDGTARNVVIFDSIEQGWKESDYQGKPHWEGTLRGVDLSEAKDMGFDGVEVYVNTSKFYENGEIASNHSGNNGLRPSDLTAENGWEKIDPDTYKGWADVKTIAFAMGKDKLFGQEDDQPNEVNVYLKMTAPDTVSEEQSEGEQVLAYNQPAFYSEKYNNTTEDWVANTTIANVVTIGIKAGEEDIPAITKKLTGEGIPLTFSETCEFAVTPVGDAPAPVKSSGDKVSSVKLTVGGSRLSAVSEDNGSLYFTEPSIDPENPNVYEYIISEKAGENSAVTYSKEKYKVVYNVSDERRDVQYDDDTELEIETVIYKITDAEGKALENPVKVSSIVFENSYKAEPVKAKLPAVSKKIEGDERPEEKTFTFVLTAKDNAPVPENGKITIKGEGEAEFGEIEFTKAGTYDYLVYESKGSDGGYTYSDRVYDVKVTVTDDNGKLSVSDTVIKSGSTPAEGEDAVFDKDEKSIVFVNSYDTEATDKVSIPTVSKEYTGAERPSDKKFSFTISGEDGAPVPGKTTVSVTGIGTAEFGSLVFDKAGTYTYTITEDELGEDTTGYTRDDSTYEYTVVVSDKDGKLTAHGRLTDKNGKPAETAVFTNRYEPLPAEYTFPAAVKKIDGTVPEGEDKSFTFVLNPVTDGAPMPERNTASVKGSGTANAFGKVKFTKAGNYTYEVYERDLSDDCTGYTRDNSVYTLDIKVYNDDGQLKTEAKLTKNGKAADKAEFVNGYKPAKAELELPAVNKTIDGDTGSNEDKTFTFTVSGDEGAPLPEKTTLSITGSGTALFDKIVFDKAGTYRYTITEDEHGNTGYSRDAAVYTVTVSVADKEGRLTASAELAKDGVKAEQVSFVNKYEPVPAEADLEVSKTVTGAAPEEAEEYTFVIASVDGAPVPENDTVTVTGEGSASFGTVTYTEPGVYTYTVSETAGSSENCTYDDRIITVTDTVTDDNGALTVDRKITANDEELDSITFVNNYEEDEEPTPEEDSSSVAESSENEPESSSSSPDSSESKPESSSSQAESSDSSPEDSSSKGIEHDADSRDTHTDDRSEPDSDDDSKGKAPEADSSSENEPESSSSAAESSGPAADSSIPEESSASDSSETSSKPVPAKDQSSQGDSSTSGTTQSKTASGSSSSAGKTATAVSKTTSNPSTGSKTLIGAQAALMAAALVVLGKKKKDRDEDDK